MSARHHLDPSRWHSVARRLDELLSAGLGGDLLPEVLRLVLAARQAQDEGAAPSAEALPRLLAAAQARWPQLEAGPFTAPPATLARCAALLCELPPWEEAGVDALFEQIVARQARGAFGQFFTPRVVVEALVQILDPQPGERLLDPACGSGAFLSQSRGLGLQRVGVELDPRALSVAQALLALAGRPARLLRGDALDPAGPLGEAEGAFDLVLSNPPFAGDVSGAYVGAYALGGPRVERDLLFVERAVRSLAPGGRMALVLPHNKLGGARFAPFRRWLFEHCAVAGVLGLPREAFLPHTHQKTAVLFARRRAAPRPPAPEERLLFVQCERSGKDPRGRPLLDPAGFFGLDCDLAEAIAPLRAALAEARWLS